MFFLFHLSWRDNEKLDVRPARVNELRYKIDRTEQLRCYSKTKQNPQHSPLRHLFFWALISYNQPLSRVCMLVFEGSTPAPKSVIICVCRFKGESPLHIHVNNVACQEILVLACMRHLLLVRALTRSTINMPKFHSPPLPRPAAACWWAQTTVEEDGKMEDTAAAAAVAAPEARNSLNSHREQVFLLFLTNPEISEEE